VDVLHNEPELPNVIRLARRGLEEIHGYELLEDLKWFPKLKRWVIRYRVTIDVEANDFVPVITQWYCHIHPHYPQGSIKIFPDAEASITHTFPHQEFNGYDGHSLWRSGDICVKTSLGKWGTKLFDGEPNTASEKLHWYIQRCIEWIRAAANGTLTKEGEPFELPAYPDGQAFRFVFNENSETFSEWSRRSDSYGVCVANNVGVPRTFALNEFEIGTSILKYKWGKNFDNKGKDFHGIWMMLPNVPVLKPWQLPTTLDELYMVCSELGIGVREIITSVFCKFKHYDLGFVCLGFPVSENFGGPCSLIHWLAFQLSPPPNLKGFEHKRELRLEQSKSITSPAKKISWLKSENWNDIQTGARGRIGETIRNANTLLVGAGAVGSLFTEMLVRLGVNRLHIVDDDLLSVGNLSRHSLNMNDVGSFKSEALAKHLNQIFPLVSVTHTTENLLEFLEDTSALSDYSLVIEATGNDDVFERLQSLGNSTSTSFISLSMSVNADRLFCFVAKDTREEIITDFRKKMEPLLHQQKSVHAQLKFPWEGIGCWHPIFPARLDDIEMLLGCAVKKVEDALQHPTCCELFLIEKNYDEQNIFTGLTISTM